MNLFFYPILGLKKYTIDSQKNYNHDLHFLTLEIKKNP